MNSDDLKLMYGHIAARLIDYNKPVSENEFSVFSQFGDDGIIQYLLNKIKPVNKFFIEFGVENYLESNTRFLMQNNNWSGFVMDGSEAHIASIKNAPFFWKHDLTAVQAFITTENINKLLAENVKSTTPGLLHIDIDGNDYWIWKAINSITPDIVIVEYNSVFGYERSITIPYHPDFVRTKYHHSNLYAGSSILALCNLAEEKGYYFVGSNNAGNNAYFIKKEKIGDMKPLTAREGYVESKFRESRDKKGNLTFLAGEKRLEEIKGMQVYNTLTNQLESL